MGERLVDDAVEAHENRVGRGLDLGEDHRAVSVDDEDELGTLREPGLDVEDQVKVALVGGVGGLAVVGTVDVLAVLVLGVQRLLADVGAVRSVRTILERDGLPVGAGLGLGAHDDGGEARATLNALVGILRVVHLHDGVLDVGELLRGEARDVALGRVLGIGGVDRISHDVETLEDSGVDDRGDRGRRGPEGARGTSCELLGDVHLSAQARLGDDVAGVLEHDDALLGSLHAELGGSLVVEDGLGHGAVRVGLVEELDVDHELEDAAGVLAERGEGLILSELLDHEVVGRLGNVRLEGATVLGDRVLHELRVALLGGEVGAAVGDGVENHPVGAEHAVPAGVAQNRDVVLGIGAANVLAEALGVVGVVGDAIARHHGRHLLGRGVEVHAAVEERNEVGVEVGAREDVPLAGVGVVITAALVGTLAHEVLEHDAAGLGAPALVVSGLVVAPRGLHAAAKCPGKVTVQSGVLGHGTGQTRAARLRVDVDLRTKLATHTRGAPGASLPHAGLTPEVLVHSRGKAVARRNVEEDVGIGVVQVRDAVGTLLADLLNRVDPADGGGVGLLVCGETGDARTRTGLDPVVRLGVAARRGGSGGVSARPQQREDVLSAQGVGKGLGAVLGGLTPVLPHVELPVTVHIAERIAVNLDNLGGVHGAQLGATLLGDPSPAVTHFLARPLGLDALAVRVNRVGIGSGGGKRVIAGRARASSVVATGKAHQARRDRRGREEVPTRDVAHIFLLPKSYRSHLGQATAPTSKRIK